MMILLALLVVLSQPQQVSSEAIVNNLIFAQSIEQKEPKLAFTIRNKAVRSAFDISTGQRTEALNKALLAELVRTTAQMKFGRRQFQGESEGEYHLTLISAVADWKNPLIIPALVDCLGTGGTAMHTLANFGESAFIQVHTVATKSSEFNVLQGALLTLDLMIEKSTINQYHRTQLEELAWLRLSKSSGGVGPLSAAARLAVSTGNPLLRARVVELSNNPQKLDEIGLRDKTEQRLFQNIANDALK